MSVAVTFTVDGHEYVVRRRLHLSASGATSDLDFLRDGISLKAPVMAETQRLIEQVTGPFALWSQTARVRQQGGAGEFLESVPARRRELLRQIIVNDAEWDVWAKGAGVKLRWHEARGLGLAALIGVAEEGSTQAGALRVEYGEAVSRAGQASVLRDKARDALRAAEAEVAASQEAERRVSLAKQTRAALAQAVDDAEARWRLARSKAESAAGALKEADFLRKRLASLQEAQAENEAAVKRWNEALQEAAAIAATLRVTERGLTLAQRELDRLVADDRRLRDLTAEYDGITRTECSLCGQELNTPEARLNVSTRRLALSGRMAALDPGGQLARRLTDAKDSVLQAAGTLAALQERQPTVVPAMPALLDISELGEVTTRLALAEAAGRDLSGLRDEMESARVNVHKRVYALDDFGPVPQVDAGETRMAEIRARSLALANKDAEANATAAQAEATRLAERLRRAEEQAAAVPALRAKQAESEGHAQTWRLLAEACGPAGVRQLMIDQGLAALETGANRWLELLSPEFRIAFSTLSETGRETLEEGVQGPFGLLSFADLSGAQSVAVGLAVRLALSELGGVAHGVRHETLVLDEVDAWLTGERQDAYLRLLEKLGERGYDALVISHIDGVRDLIPQRIELTATAQGTEVRTA